MKILCRILLPFISVLLNTVAAFICPTAGVLTLKALGQIIVANY
jgi:uncharacterized membrane protein YqaE (UPF0057 family)